MPPAYAANLVTNSGNTIYGVWNITPLVEHRISYFQGDGEFSWTATEQSQLLAAYYYGYAALQVSVAFFYLLGGHHHLDTFHWHMRFLQECVKPLPPHCSSSCS